MRLGDGTKAIILVGLGVIAIVNGVRGTAGLIGLAVALLVVSLLLESQRP